MGANFEGTIGFETAHSGGRPLSHWPLAPGDGGQCQDAREDGAQRPDQARAHRTHHLAGLFFVLGSIIAAIVCFSIAAGLDFFFLI